MGLTLAQMLVAMQVELEISNDEAVFSDALLTRGVVKSVALMSRQIPKIAITESRLVREITGETLTIATNTGTTTLKPIRVGTLKIPSKKENVDYSVNHMTGVVTEIDSNLPDTDYTISYSLDPQSLDLSTFLTDYMRIDRIEYPAGQIPPNYIKAGDIFESFMFFNDDVTLTTNEIIRLTYRTVWAEPGVSAGDYPPSLDTPIIIGAIGQALISKAQLYTIAAQVASTAAKTLLDAITAVTIPSAPDISSFQTDTDTALDAAIVRLASAVTEAAKMDAALALSATAIASMAAESALSNTQLDSAIPKIIVVQDADRVAENYALVADGFVRVSGSYGNESDKNILLSRTWGERATKETTIATGYITEAMQRLGAARRDLEKYQLQMAKAGHDVSYHNSRIQQALGYENNARQFLDIAGRYLASGQAKINEMLLMLGLKPEYNMYKSSPGQFE